ncbi:ATP-binding protein [Cytobacillus sp. IB215316]|uniref:hybrid sensor histidine kinase/response regulator n=1 Tax=Cytobacillus sp. IB215316 TaxID=3097354 RepID=UPI002A15A768|nr:ATP-binding protein [Cytobacillus sp. IB215316]MDX8361828.1 ATP-binding protein [Cytobacillus sp. IB215316]
MSKHERQMIIIGLILAILFLYFLNPVTNSNPSAPTANKGVIDLTNWNFKKDGLVSLNGNWEFYENVLLQPAILNKNDFSNNFRNVPNVGNQIRGTSVINKDGFATYRLKVLLNDKHTDQLFGIKINDIRMAHKLFINGYLVGQSGEPTNNVETQQIGNIPYAKYFPLNQSSFELVIQVSKYDYYDGGIIDDIEFGLQEDISKLQLISFGTDLAIIFVLLLFCVYHMSIYFMKMKSNKFYLYNGLFFLCLLISYSCRSEKLFMLFFPSISIDTAYKIQDISAYSAILFIFLFLHALDATLLSKRVMRIACSLLVIYPLIVLLFPYDKYTHMEMFFLFISGGCLSFIFFKLVRVFIKRKYDEVEKRELLLLSSIFIFLFFMYFGTINFFDIMVALTGEFIQWEPIIKTRSQIIYDLGQYREISIVIFVAVMYILLALRYTHTFGMLESLSNKLISMNKMKDEFLAKTSHELKTPLHGIINISSYLLDKKDQMSNNERNNLTLIHDTSVKLSNLVNDLIDVSRLKNGQLQLHIATVDIKVSAQIVFDVLAFEVQGKNIDLINNLHDYALVEADENRLRQILYNLIHNAIKHTERGEITVSSQKIEETLYIYIEDTGIGIPDEKREEIFSYYEQLDQFMQVDSYQSMGLGLYISRQLIEKMNGRIWVDWTEVGIGSRFCFTLPIAQNPKLVEEVASTTTASTYRQNEDLQSDNDTTANSDQTILIVDDERANIQVLQNMLSKQHFKVIISFSANDALSKLNEHPHIDLVITDVMMPEMSGIELCQKIRESKSFISLPVLLATVKDMPEDIALGFSAGANDYITKPFDSNTILARIQTLLAMKTSMEDAFNNELAFLQAQIKPHFLHNALSTIASLCYTNVDDAIRLLKMLNQYLRIIYNTTPQTMFIPLEQELQLIEAYVEIERVRFKWLNFTASIDDELDGIYIPALCIQPFVENAIRHGVFNKKGEGNVSLSITNRKTSILIIIEDDGVGLSEEALKQFKNGELKNAGIGMTNIRRRLASLNEAHIQVDSKINCGTKITLELRKRVKDDLYDTELEGL